MSELAPGTEIAGCRIEAVAGRGGMGVIYRATEIGLGRPVAVKLIAAERASDDAFRSRFERESRLTASIEHPNVIPVYAAGEDGGVLYLVMRFVGGTDLRSLLRREIRLRPERAVAIVAQVAAGLDAAHAAGLVHRDVKPANVLIDEGGHVYLSDFGITRTVDGDTRLTDSGDWVGTVDFMAPEHLQGRDTDARSDVYALGCVLYTALTGTPPFRRDTAAQTISAHLHERPPQPSRTEGVPEAFDRVIARALAKEPAGRYPSAGDLARAATAAAQGEHVTESERSVARGPAAPHDAPTVTNATRLADPATHVAPPAPDYKVRRSRRGRGLAVGAGAVVALGAAGLVAGLILSGDDGGSDAKPLSAAEVRSAAQGFARAYGAESVPALRRVLAPNVKRIVPGDTQVGRVAVVAEYSRQFQANEVRTYRLTDLDARGGEAGRATGSYEVVRAGRSPITGDIVFGVVREAGRPKIALIAAEPTS
jgi:Protein kinase domain